MTIDKPDTFRDDASAVRDRFFMTTLDELMDLWDKVGRSGGSSLIPVPGSSPRRLASSTASARFGGICACMEVMSLA